MADKWDLMVVWFNPRDDNWVSHSSTTFAFRHCRNVFPIVVANDRNRFILLLYALRVDGASASSMARSARFLRSTMEIYVLVRDFLLWRLFVLATNTLLDKGSIYLLGVRNAFCWGGLLVAPRLGYCAYVGIVLGNH